VGGWLSEEMERREKGNRKKGRKGIEYTRRKKEGRKV
jgi:hypothetical protein